MTDPNDSLPPVVFWQQIVSPHMAPVAEALAARGHRVTYVATKNGLGTRAELGWAKFEFRRAKAQLATSPAQIESALEESGPYAINLCEGLRGNGLISLAQGKMRRLGRRYWVVLETPRDAGALAYPRRMVYRALIARYGDSIRGYLATGDKTGDYLESCGAKSRDIFPFSYFLDDRRSVGTPLGERFRLVFVGRFDRNKNVELILAALRHLNDPRLHLKLVGDGPLRNRVLRQLREQGASYEWTGVLPRAEVSRQIGECDCLILPSKHDGWGAVISESLQVGTPVICSDACGGVAAVIASGHGAVFKSGSAADLASKIESAFKRGRFSSTERERLSDWASCLGATAGAAYLEGILFRRELGRGEVPQPPWSVATPAVERRSG